MVTTVTLQPPFEYYWWVIVIAVLLFAAAVALLIWALNILFHIFPKRIRKEKPVIKTPPAGKLPGIKANYAGQLQKLVSDYTNKLIDKRSAYQRLSLLIRSFVADVTGINVDKFTKSEIKAFGIKRLDVLMEEYYIPEFAEKERSKNKNFITSCNRALEVIKTWN